MILGTSRPPPAIHEKILKNKYKYQPSTPIGEGSYGYVYLGQSLVNGENLAVKVVEKSKIDSEE